MVLSHTDVTSTGTASTQLGFTDNNNLYIRGNTGGNAGTPTGRRCGLLPMMVLVLDLMLTC